MTANAVHGHINRIDIGVGVTLGDADVADLQVGFVVKPERVIRFWPAGVKPVAQHGARTSAEFFRRLPDEHDRAMPLVFQFRQ